MHCTVGGGFVSPKMLRLILFMYCPDSALDLEWKLIYVGSAESEMYDQELDDIMVGPVPVGVNKFVFQVSGV